MTDYELSAGAAVQSGQLAGRPDRAAAASTTPPLEVDQALPYQDIVSHVGAAEAGSGARQPQRDTADREVAVLISVGRALMSWDRFESSSERLLRDLAQALGLAAGVLWLRQDEMLFAGAIWSEEGIDRVALESAIRQLRFPAGIGLPGCAWERREPIYQTTSTASESSPRRPSAPGGVRGSVALPASTGEEVLGVVELYGSSHVALSDGLTPVLSTAGRALGILLERWRGNLVHSPLTAREVELLALASRGLSGPEIAEQLSISLSTVKTHFEHVRTKLRVRDRTAAVAYVLRAGIIA